MTSETMTSEMMTTTSETMTSDSKLSESDLAPLATFLVRTTKTTLEKIKADLDTYFEGDVIDISTSNEYYMTEEIKWYSVDINYTTPKLNEFVDKGNYQQVLNYEITINTIWRDDWDQDFNNRYKIK
jgi:hypothetical protein